ncbi:FUSC family protein [Mycobacterium sp.]|uniref:FUSC family protein n=1 Tax=Mycobacterium sp. TaxID=1785 RepID=UPI002B7FECE9|nr:FUSC family protein [Mycobacterium sp.]HTQ20165.1 FUSC family protein [Mycobacterium sp.]
MSTSLQSRAARVADRGQAAFERLRDAGFTILQTAVTAGLAWYIAHDVLHHPQPFFAPVSAAVCLSASNVLRGVRAIQMIVGVALGIVIGVIVQKLLGVGPVPIGVAALFALACAVLLGRGYIGQGLMFVNQTTVSAILVLALFRSGVSFERIYDALIGGGLALIVAILFFPADPLKLVGSARAGVLQALHGVLCRTADFAAGRKKAPTDWPLSAVDRVHEQLGALIQARTTARQVVKVAPRRWGMRQSVYGADEQALYVALLAGSVMQLARVVAPTLHDPDWLPRPVPALLTSLASATRLSDVDPVAAAAYASTASHHASVLQSEAHEKSQVVLAGVVQACVDDLQRVIELSPAQLTSNRRETPGPASSALA